MTTQIVEQKSNIMEQVLIVGDLAKLTPEQRMSYYMETCKSLGLNPLSRPFDYIMLNGRLTLYARKDATDQIRKLNRVSIDDVDIKETDSQFVVTVKGHDKDGRADVDIGAVNKNDMRGDASNAMMKAVTKGKRRFTLSICGLGMLDETEIETIPDARPVVVTDHGEIVEHAQPQPSAPAPAHPKPNGGYNPVNLLVENGLAENNFEAVTILNKYAPKEVKGNADALLAWTRQYRTWRDAGRDPAVAAENATKNAPFED